MIFGGGIEINDETLQTGHTTFQLFAEWNGMGLFSAIARSRQYLKY